MSIKEKEDLFNYLQKCIEKNYLLIMAVTSYTQGKLKSENLPFGVGKTSCAMWLNAWMNNFGWKDEHWRDNIDWDKTKKNMFYDYTDVTKRLKNFSGRANNAVLDDLQATAPATKYVDRNVYDFAFYLTTSRPEIATITFTCPNTKMIAAPLRNIVNIELIVPTRGIFEVQRIKNYKNFKRPTEDISKLRYLEEGVFDELPKEMQVWYDDWRVDEKRKWHRKHPKASGGEDDDFDLVDNKYSENKFGHNSKEKVEFLKYLVVEGRIKKSEAKNRDDWENIKELMDNKYIQYSSNGYAIIPSRITKKLF